jgi:hypothetical protein
MPLRVQLRSTSVALACALVVVSGCAHATVPRLVITGRLTGRPTATEVVGGASLAVPLDARPPPPLPGPAIVPYEPVDPSSLSTYPGEPTVEAVLESALALRTLDPARAAEARERARLSGLLPILRADVRRGSGWDLRTQQTATSDSAVLANEDSWSVLGSVTLRLDRLLFAREETSLLSEERRLEEARMRLVAEIVRLYFERRRLQLERDRRGETDLAVETRIAELGAAIDALSDGALSGRAHASGR